MKKHLHCIALLLGLFFCGHAMAVEEPKFDVLVSDGPFEVRKYAPVLVAETLVEGDMDEASNKGFRLIADFIFGNNQVANPSNTTNTTSSEKIAMTAPVVVTPQSAKIAMTAPVTVLPHSAGADMQSANQWWVQFIMPSQYTLANIPKPKNSAVRLREVAPQHFVVLKYSGFNTLSRVQLKTQEAIDWMTKQQLKPIGTPQLARYDPPWTLPMFRRNEIMIEIAAP